MNNNVKQKVVIVGCGNLAWHLAKHLFSLKKFELYVYNHQPNSALNNFKTKFNCKVQDSLTDVIKNANYYFLCVADKVISSVSKNLNGIKSGVAVLTSGSGSMDDLDSAFANKGVFYPVQTFSVDDHIKWAEIPIVIEGNNTGSLKKMKAIAELFSERTVALNSADRLKLHLAAVLVNNFANSLYAAADNFISTQIKNKEVNFKILLPLIEQTALKVKKISPANAQTGPAKRHDKKVIKKHLKLIKDKDLKEVYRQMSGMILAQQKDRVKKKQS